MPSGIERRLRGRPRSGSGDGSDDGGTTAEEILHPVRKFAESYNVDDYDALLSILTANSPVRERVSPELLERYDLPTIATRQIASNGGAVEVTSTLTIRTEDGSESDFTTSFIVQQSQGDWLLHQIRDPAPMLADSGTPTTMPADEETTTGDDETTTPVADDGVYGFEGGLAVWTVEREEWGQRDEVAYAGAYSGGITAGGPDTGDFIGTLATATPDPLSSGGRPSAVSHYWYEREASFGGGLRLVNSEGDVELGTATNNPEWLVDGDDGPTELYAGDGYGRWVRVDIAFDWDAGTATVAFEDQQSGSRRSTEVGLAGGVDIEALRLSGFTTEQGWRTESCHMFWDEIMFEE
jgi:hypothetical protein